MITSDAMLHWTNILPLLHKWAFPELLDWTTSSMQWFHSIAKLSEFHMDEIDTYLAEECLPKHYPERDPTCARCLGEIAGAIIVQMGQILHFGCKAKHCKWRACQSSNASVTRYARCRVELCSLPFEIQDDLFKFQPTPYLDQS